MKETEAASKRHKNISPQASALPDKDTHSFVVARDQTAARIRRPFDLWVKYCQYYLLNVFGDTSIDMKLVVTKRQKIVSW